MMEFEEVEVIPKNSKYQEVFDLIDGLGVGKIICVTLGEGYHVKNGRVSISKAYPNCRVVCRGEKIYIHKQSEGVDALQTGPNEWSLKSD